MMAWSSPGIRLFASDFLRVTATWIEPKGEKDAKQNPKHFQVPNPFYQED